MEELPASFFEHDRRVRASAIRALRRRTQRRQTSRAAVALALILGCVMVISGRRAKPDLTALPLASGASASKSPVPPASGHEPGGVQELSDQQLLAVFPPGSCFLAEVNGQKRLVFIDPKVKQRFFN